MFNAENYIDKCVPVILTVLIADLPFSHILFSISPIKCQSLPILTQDTCHLDILSILPLTITETEDRGVQRQLNL